MYHPFLGNNTVFDIANAMFNNNLKVIGLEVLDDSIFPYVLKEAKKTFWRRD